MSFRNCISSLLIYFCTNFIYNLFSIYLNYIYYIYIFNYIYKLKYIFK